MFRTQDDIEDTYKMLKVWELILPFENVNNTTEL